MPICKECKNRLACVRIGTMTYCGFCGNVTEIIADPLKSYTLEELRHSHSKVTESDRVSNRIDPTPYAVAAAASFGVTPEVMRDIKAGRPHSTLYPLAPLPVQSVEPTKIDYSDWYDTDID